jgi:fumarate hydratase class I
MLKLRDGIVELYRKAATSVPPDIEEALKNALASEENALAKESLSRILDNIRTSRQKPSPVCEDTGIPLFSVKAPRGLSHIELRNTIREATVIATGKIPLRPNAVDIITSENSGDNTGIGVPIIYCEETTDDTLKIDLMLRGSGCEDVGRGYRLPDEALGAGMNLDGVMRCALDAVEKVQGKGCPPYILGIGVGATDYQVAVLAKHQLFRRMNDSSEYPSIADLEQSVLAETNRMSNRLGTTTTLGVKIGITHRHPSSCYVYVSVSCWASRRARLIW